MSEIRRCACGNCECDYQLEGYAPDEQVCGACLDNCKGAQAQEDEANAANAPMRLTGEQLDARKPAWAKSLIVAELEVNGCDSMTDYYATSTSRVVALAWSRTTRDTFSEMRKAAATFPDTRHLGPGCNIFTPVVVLGADAPNENGAAYWKGSQSPWHYKLDGGMHSPVEFPTRAAAEAFIAQKGEPEPVKMQSEMEPTPFRWVIRETDIEHRERHSMGAGYYLKGGNRYSSGWKVRKRSWWDSGAEDGFHSSAADAPGGTIVAVDGVTVTPNAEKGGIELRFPERPDQSVLDALKAGKWRWHRRLKFWYAKDTPDTRAFAASLTTHDTEVPVNHPMTASA